jgi:hypothetical protein
MARFGLLILNKGNWNGNQIMTDTNYFNEMVNTSQTLNKSYGYLWWLNGKQSFMVPTLQTVFPGFMSPNAPADMISAIGSGGQFLNVVPSQKLIWLRMGDEPGNSNVPFLLNDAIWEYVIDLSCATTELDEVPDFSGIALYPNPSSDVIQLKINSSELLTISVYNANGQLQLETNSPQFSIEKLEKGCYFVEVKTNKGKHHLKLIKE